MKILREYIRELLTENTQTMDLKPGWEQSLATLEYMSAYIGDRYYGMGKFVEKITKKGGSGKFEGAPGFKLGIHPFFELQKLMQDDNGVVMNSLDVALETHQEDGPSMAATEAVYGEKAQASWKAARQAAHRDSEEAFLDNPFEALISIEEMLDGDIPSTGMMGSEAIEFIFGNDATGIIADIRSHAQAIANAAENDDDVAHELDDFMELQGK